MLRIAPAEVRPRTDAGDAHLTHMALDGFPVDDEVIVLLEHDRDAARAVRWVVGVNPINGMLDGDFLGRGRDRLIVQTAPTQAEQLGLLDQRQLGLTPVDQGKALISGQGRGQIFFVATRPGS